MCSRAPEMSHSRPSVIDEVQRVLNRARAEGKEQDVLQVIQQSFTSENLELQGMSDASKRQRGEPSEEWELMSEAPSATTTGRGYGPQVPVAPKAPASTSATSAAPASSTGASQRGLPVGITSVEQWGSTV